MSASLLFGKLPQADRQVLLSTRWCKQASKPLDNLHFLMRVVCQESLINSLRVLLDEGVSPSYLPARAVINSTREFDYHNDVFPLGMVEGPNAVEMVDMLLERGAQPNYGFSMHWACDCAQTMRRLLEKGGNPHQVCMGKSVIDHWFWIAHSPTTQESKDSALAVFDALLEGGFDMSRPTDDGSAFLVACWGSPFLRKHIPYFIEKDADPFQKGQGKGPKRLSLVEHLEKKVHSGKLKPGSPVAQMYANFQAQVLEETTACPDTSASRPRL